MRFLSGGTRRTNNTGIKHGTIKLLVSSESNTDGEGGAKDSPKEVVRPGLKQLCNLIKPDRWAVNEAIVPHPDKMMQAVFLAANV